MIHATFASLAAAAAFLLLLPTNSMAQSTVRTTVNGGTVDLATCVNQETQFTIQLVYMGTSQLDPRYEEAFEAAAKRWMKVIVGDVPDVGAGVVDDWFGGEFAPKTYSGAVDDLVIGYDIPTTIDGPGGQLGGAGPVFLRQDRRGRPLSTISGIMIFDGADLDTMALMDVKAIIQHEMGHVLGLVGTTNERCNFSCNSENPDVQSGYSCPLAGAEYQAIAPGNLDLENQGGMGTACGHWEEDNFRTSASSEVMTGFFEANLLQPLSSVTVAGLQDIGYEVDFCGADIWPADDNTIQRFEIFRTEQEMNMADSTMMRGVTPQWGMDPATGDMTSWNSLNRTMPLDDDDAESPSSAGVESVPLELATLGTFFLGVAALFL